MPDLGILGSLATSLHDEFRNLFFVFLPVFFALALVMAWFRNPAGSPDFLEVLKRAIVATLLLTAFEEITSAILAVTNGVADKISSMNGIDAYLKMVAEKAKSYPNSSMTVVLAIDDFIMASLSYLSYLVVYLARYLMVAVYNFSWLFLVIVSPLLLLFHVFTSQITVNLFRTLIEVASWQIVWAVLSAMLNALPYGNYVKAEGEYLTLIIMNFVIAIALFLTPLLVKAIVGGSFSAVAASLGPLATTSFLAMRGRTSTLLTRGREVLSNTSGYVTHQMQSRRGPVHASGLTAGQIAAEMQSHFLVPNARSTAPRPNGGGPAQQTSRSPINGSNADERKDNDPKH